MSEAEKECRDAWSAAICVYLIEHPFTRLMAGLFGVAGLTVSTLDIVERSNKNKPPTKRQKKMFRGSLELIDWAIDCEPPPKSR